MYTTRGDGGVLRYVEAHHIKAYVKAIVNLGASSVIEIAFGIV
jgi:hypothetical protein